MIDIHNHIIPGVDDGPKSWDITREMIGLAARDGIEHIVATPHASDTYEYDRSRLNGLLSELRAQPGDALQFSLGCEVHLSYWNIQDVFANPSRYAIANTPYILVEFSLSGVPTRLGELLFRLQAAGLKPILAHPERYALVQRQPEKILEWIAAGCIIQVTASALTGFWRERAQKMAHWLLKHDAVHVLATDAHDAVRRPPILSPGREDVARLCGQDVAQAITVDNPAAIIAGQALPYRPSPILKS
jgi:protein-tyrosine phosphatase